MKYELSTYEVVYTAPDATHQSRVQLRCDQGRYIITFMTRITTKFQDLIWDRWQLRCDQYLLLGRLYTRCDTDKFSKESAPQLSTINMDNNQN